MSMEDYCPVVHKGFVIVRPIASSEIEALLRRMREANTRLVDNLPPLRANLWKQLSAT